MKETTKIIGDFLKTLQLNNEPADIIKKILAFTLEIYAADRAYIFESDPELGMGVNTYEYCAEGIKPEIDNLQGVAFDDAPRWAEKFYAGETIFITDINDLKHDYESEYKILESQDITSLIAVPFLQNGINGYIGIDNPRKMKDDDSVLRIMIFLIINAIVELNLKKDLLSSTKNINIKTKNDIYIKTFGKFEINTFLGSFHEESVTSKQSLIFFAYLLFHRKEYVTVDTLTNIIWPNQVIYEPYAYVKNVAFRTRKSFKNFIGEDFIIAKDGSYSCNEKLNIITDFDLMETAYEAAKNTTSNLEKITYYGKIIDLYEGSMLPKLNSEVWLLNISAKYKNMYIDTIEQCFKLLLEKEEYDTLLRLSDKVLKVNVNIPMFHYYTVLTYIKSGKKEIAKSYLRQSKELFQKDKYKELSDLL